MASRPSPRRRSRVSRSPSSPGIEVVYLKGFGVREEGKPDTVDADTVFQLASFSKPISATVVAAVVGEGKIDWDSRRSPISTRRSACRRPIRRAQLTVRDLFAHRSGLPGDAGNELEGLGFDQDDDPATACAWCRSTASARTTPTAISASPRARSPWRRRAASPGRIWPRTKLYRPLGMTATSSRYADFLAQPNRAALHVGSDGAWSRRCRRGSRTPRRRPAAFPPAPATSPNGCGSNSTAAASTASS